MNFSYSETHQLIRDTARKFAEERLSPGTVERDEQALFPAEQVKEIVHSAWDSLPARFLHVMLDEFVLMPNHVHGIIILRPLAEAESPGGAASSAPTLGRAGEPPGGGAASSAPTLGQVVRAFKSVSAIDRKSTRLNSSHSRASRMPSSA